MAAAPETPRYHMLDGVRGVAALAVVLLHLGQWQRLPEIAPRGYLAVDLFFVLSGFVVAKSYEGRLKAGMAFGEFARRRVLRLWPVLLAATALGLALTLALNPAAAPDRVAAVWKGAASGVLLLWPEMHPLHDMSLRGYSDFATYPLDPPLWSLAFEVYANLAWALLAPRLSTRALAATWALAVIAFAAGGHGPIAEAGNLPATWTLGLARTWASFGAGALLARLPAPPRKAAPWLVLLATGIVLWTRGESRLLDLGLVLAGAPLVVWMGQAAALSGRTATACDWAGRLSYPLYALHFVLRPFFDAGLARVKTPAAWLALNGVFLASALGLSLAVLLLIDEPARRRLTRRPAHRTTALAATAP